MGVKMDNSTSSEWQITSDDLIEAAQHVATVLRDEGRSGLISDLANAAFYLKKPCVWTPAIQQTNLATSSCSDEQIAGWDWYARAFKYCPRCGHKIEAKGW